MVYIMPSYLPAIDPYHVWFATMNELRGHLDDIVEKCMIHGEIGWPPHMGGVSLIEHKFGKFILFALCKLPGFDARMPIFGQTNQMDPCKLRSLEILSGRLCMQN